jgi:NAD(P)-dependent dehydrogenase (short-subunit alcohol dehydrogenase family)
MAALDGRVALITGGASGIGAACAQRLAAEGATVIVTDIQDELGHRVVADIAKAGGRARYFHHDVTSEEAWVDVVAEIKAAFGRLDILVNNAGIGLGSASITTMELAAFRRQQAINVDGVFLGIKHSLLLMREAGNGGSIINMSSVAGLKGSPAKDGVRVNSVHPGIIETPIWLGIGGSTSGANTPPDLDALSTMAVPLGVKGIPEDIAAGVLWLASDQSRYVTGAELVIDGGLSVR